MYPPLMMPIPHGMDTPGMETPGMDTLTVWIPYRDAPRGGGEILEDQISAAGSTGTPPFHLPPQIFRLWCIPALTHESLLMVWIP